VVLAFIDNLLADPGAFEDATTLINRMSIRKSMENSSDHYIAKMTSQIRSILDESYARLSNKTILRIPRLCSAREIYKFNFCPTDATPGCQNNQGVCIVEEMYGFRPRMAHAAFCRFCFANVVKKAFNRNIIDDTDCSVTLNPVQFVSGVDGEYANSYMFSRMLRKPKGSTGRELVKSSYDDLPDGDGKFYGIIGPYPNMDIEGDFEVVNVRVTRVLAHATSRTFVVKGLREKSHCFYENRLPDWINDYSQI